MNKYQNKYRKFTRLQQWDYRWAGAYFITICTHNREPIRNIQNATMQLSQVGVIADLLWYEIPFHSRNVELGEFVVMPNHIHGVIIITNDNDNGNDNIANNVVDNVVDNVGTGHALTLPQPPQPPQPSQPIQPPQPIQPEPKTIGQQRFQNIGKNSISSIVGSYKSAVTKHAHRLGFSFEWQTRFYDHIIRDDNSFQRISNYIINNPAKWEEDKFFNK